MSYTEGYSTEYGLSVTDTNDTEFTINTWFEFADRSAKVMIDSPASTNIELEFASNDFAGTPTVEGAVSSSYDSETKILTFTVNTDTSPYFILFAEIALPFDYNFWFVIVGLITFCAVTFYALVIMKGRR